MADDEIRTDDAADAEQANWTIKAVPTRTRILARTCATRAHKSTAAWLSWAIEVAAERQGHGAVLPPRGSLANPSANHTADSATAEGQPGIPPALIELARLAVELTPPGRDSAAMRTMRSVVKRRAVALLLETRDGGQPVTTKKANKQLAAPAEPAEDES